MRSLLMVGVVLVVSSCGTSKSLVTEKYQKLETWQICKKMLEDDMASWKVPWANDVLRERGENCEKYIGRFKPSSKSVTKPKSTTTVCVPLNNGMVMCSD